MARLLTGRGGSITLLVLSLAIFGGPFAAGQSLYERPVLIVDPGMRAEPLCRWAVRKRTVKLANPCLGPRRPRNASHPADLWH
jgi:hypothetical protein